MLQNSLSLISKRLKGTNIDGSNIFNKMCAGYASAASQPHTVVKVEARGIIEAIIHRNIRTAFSIFHMRFDKTSPKSEGHDDTLSFPIAKERLYSNTPCTFATVENIGPRFHAGELLSVVGRFDIKVADLSGQYSGKPAKDARKITDTNIPIERLYNSLKNGSISAYLRSIKGIGEKTANAIINALPSKHSSHVLDIMDNGVMEWRATGESDFISALHSNPSVASDLLSINGVGVKAANTILSYWSRDSIERDIIKYLIDGATPGQGNRVVLPAIRASQLAYRLWGNEAFDVLRSNPYQLFSDGWHNQRSTEIRASFHICDRLARASPLHVRQNDRRRINAGIICILAIGEISAGHCALPRDIVISRTAKLLGLENKTVEDSIKSQINDKGSQKESTSWCIESLQDMPFFFQNTMIDAEVTIAKRVKSILSQGVPAWLIDRECGPDFGKCDNLQNGNLLLSEQQELAAKNVLSSKISVLTGGPGTGKTTVIRAIVEALIKEGYRVGLCAPTGRASKNLSNATRKPASTIHRLMNTNSDGQISRNEFNPLEVDLLVVDETSMVDNQLMAQLLSALDNNTALLLVGDVDQLPPVGAGLPFRALVESHYIPVIRLTEVHRQSATSEIIRAAHLINKGRVPFLKRMWLPGAKQINMAEGFDPDLDPRFSRDTKIENVPTGDVWFYACENDAQIFEHVASLASDVIPNIFGVDPVRDIQTISPTRKGTNGTMNLNRRLQIALNPHAFDTYANNIQHAGNSFFPGDKVMQLENDYDRDIYNGDVGRVSFINTKSGSNEQLRVDFGKDSVRGCHEVSYSTSNLDQLTIAYAITIHKSQGSEYPIVILPLSLSQHKDMLVRNLIYTAVTRAKRMLILVGQDAALEYSVGRVGGGFKRNHNLIEDKYEFGSMKKDEANNSVQQGR
eukprot:UC4_evm17s805